MAGVHRDTLLRWLREGRIPEPGRDRNNWRIFTPEETEFIVRYAKGTAPSTSSAVRHAQSVYHLSLPYADSIPRLCQLDWDFVDANTGFLTHSIHPYPAKFIPQIPNAIIQELSSVNETILDPFCGSGTTLVEALRLGRHAIGVDANPLACLISQAKTTRIGEEAGILYALAEEIASVGQQASIGTLPLFPDLPQVPISEEDRPTSEGITEWFDQHIIDELAFIKKKCLELPSSQVRQLALVVFSSIIVAVSSKDSDTRYVRREKNIMPGDTLQRFSRALDQATRRTLELTAEVDERVTTQVFKANILDGPQVGPVDLVVCSPPYPNAFSYHLYHRTRMAWLDMDQQRFKSEEIGSHRKYSRKGPNAATVDTFRSELQTILSWLAVQVRPSRHVCFVIGDSTIKGETIKNDQLLIDVAASLGFRLEANINRRLQDTKKYFNPSVGRIKEEHIVILRNAGERT
jgi:site-specific DNA-methyltransferase (cytosine-N4-specific)